MKFRNILSICVSGILVLSACEDLLNTDRTGQAIRFGVSTDSGLRTRTEYKGKQDNGKELIYWKEDGSDDVTIHMFWDGDGGADGEEKDYYVSNAYEIVDKHICKGKLSPKGKSLLWKGDFSGGDGKAHEYKHSFYSVYPANSATFEKDGKQFEFELKESSSGVDMSKAYMAAGLENVTSENSPVLQYYPMITTLYVTLVNDTDNAVTPGNIVLTSTDKPICGKYTVAFDADEKKFTFKEALESGKKTVAINVDNQLQPKKAGKTDIAFFIIPQKYNSSTLSFKINGKEHNFGDSNNAPEYIEAYKKYNITVNLSGSTPPTFKETIDNGEAQFLILWLSNYLNGEKFNSFFGYSWGNDHDYNGFQNKFINGGGWDSATIAEDFLKFFTDEQLNKLYQELLKQTVFKAENKQITHPISGDFFRLFPNLEEIYIQTYSTVDVSNLKKLRTATFEYASEVTITDCDALTSVVFRNAPNLKNFTLKNCKSITKFDMTNDNQMEVWTSDAVFTFDGLEQLSSVILCSAKEVNVYDCPKLSDANISMKNPVGINRTRK